ncbi:MAG: hypothetical protein HY608_09170 [Planctomycetes bacterium]|nr:hypothetical protein [Planctomycetota bacterium]
MIGRSGGVHGPSRPASRPADVAEYDKAIEDLKRVGVIHRIDVSLNRVYVTDAWLPATVEEKRTMGHVFATYIGHHKGTGLNWCDVMHFATGRRLAKYSQSLGFEQFE